MKRLVLWAVVFVVLLLGCGADDPVPETEGTKSNITVTILQEGRDFGEFAADVCSDGEAAEKLVREVLGQYPAGFAEQWGPVEILLCGKLTGREDFAGGHWAGFTQPVDGGWLVVLDTERCTAGTVHHEIAHILDGILTRAGLLTEENWMEYCPGGFEYGGAGDYPDFFADDYAMTDIREDRARTFEDAVLYGTGVYADKPALWLKLEYFCRAVREHFDTAGWPRRTVWESALE